MTDYRPISCDECQQQLEGFALDELSEIEARQVSNHLSTGCYVCNLELAQIVSDWAVTPSQLPAELPPLRIEREIMRSIAANQPRPAMSAAEPAPVPPPTDVVIKSNRRLLAAMFAAAACLMGVVAWTSWHGNGSEFAGAPAYQAALQSRVDRADRSQHFSAIPQLKFTYVNHPAPAEPIHGYIVDDALAHQWQVYAFNLPPLSEGRTYELWLVTKDSEFISVGRLNVDASGTAAQIIERPSELPRVTAIAISDEPTIGSPKPTGPNFAKADLP